MSGTLCINMEEEVDETLLTGDEEILWKGCAEKGWIKATGQNESQAGTG